MRFFATGITAAAETTHHRVAGLLTWQEETLRDVRAAGISGAAERIAWELIGTPFLHAAHVARRHDLTHQGAMKALRRLAAEGLLEERSRNGRVTFAVPRVIALLSE